MAVGVSASGSVLVVEDDAPLRALLTVLLEQEGFPVVGAATGTDALAAVRGERPLVAVLDVNLPGTSGYELCRLLRDRHGNDLPVILISGHRTEPFDRVAGLLIGADDYLTKPFAPEELLARMRGLLRRAAGRGLAERPAHRLTARELEVLSLLAGGLSQRIIAGQLVISPKTVGTHIEHILEKLRVHSRAEAIAAAYRDGLVHAPA